MSRNIPPGVHAIRGIMGVCHLLVDDFGDAVLLDQHLPYAPVRTMAGLTWIFVVSGRDGARRFARQFQREGGAEARPIAFHG